MIEDIETLLEADVTLMALLTGGVHRASQISRELTPSAFDTTMGDVLPCALLRQESLVSVRPHTDSANLYFVLFVYQSEGYDVIDPAVSRIYLLLHDQKLSPSDGSGNYEVRHVNRLLDLYDEGIPGAFSMIRFQAVMRV